jgi:DNA-binding MurR/RpiR family transcriptional regulator
MIADQEEMDARLRSLIPRSRGQVARAIGFVLANTEVIPVQSMRELARRAGVPPVTLVRLAQKLGFDGYEGFRKVYADAYVSGRNSEIAGRLISLQSREGLLGFAAKFAASELAMQQRTLEGLSEAQLAAASDELASAERIFVIGRRPCFAVSYLFAYSLRKAKPATQLMDIGGGLNVELDGIARKDLLVGFSFHPYSRVTFGLAQTAREQGARIMAITDSADSPIARIADHVFITSVHGYAFPDSMSGALLLTNVLVGLTVAKLGEKAMDRIRWNEQQIKRSGEYNLELPTGEVSGINAKEQRIRQRKQRKTRLPGEDGTPAG